MKIILAPGGSLRREVELCNVHPTDIWHLAMTIANEEWESIDPEKASETVLELWHLAHDLLWNLKQAEPVLELFAREQEEEARPSDGYTLAEDPLSGPEGD
jgi:hypothetical protein